MSLLGIIICHIGVISQDTALFNKNRNVSAKAFWNSNYLERSNDVLTQDPVNEVSMLSAPLYKSWETG
jgi:hypothetical protein